MGESGAKGRHVRPQGTMAESEIEETVTVTDQVKYPGGTSGSGDDEEQVKYPGGTSGSGDDEEQVKYPGGQEGGASGSGDEGEQVKYPG